MENNDDYVCPSFNSYSSNTLGEIAVKVAAENTDADEDFEFSLVRQDTAEEFSYDGQIGSIFPVFNRDLLRSNDGELSETKPLAARITVPLAELLFEDHEVDNPPSCSSSEADETENIPSGSYCVWWPKVADQPSPTWCKKSRSTGSASKRWNFRDLLRRSNSDGKDSFVFLTPKNREEKIVQKKGKGKEVGAAAAAAAKPLARSAHEALYIRNRSIKEVDKKKSYLPYRRDLVGFFVNGNVFSKTFPHFHS